MGHLSLSLLSLVYGKPLTAYNPFFFLKHEFYLALFPKNFITLFVDVLPFYGTFNLGESLNR